MAESKFQVKMTDEAYRQFAAMPQATQVRVTNVFERLANWPQVSGAKPLRHSLKGQFRIRTGDYRVQFRVEGRLVIVEKIGHRDGFYEE